MSAADLATELKISHSNASYHLRQLDTAGLLVHVGERSINGGTAKLYRYESNGESKAAPDTDGHMLLWQAVSTELLRRAWSEAVPGKPRLLADAELWVDPKVWDRVVGAMHQLTIELHRSAKPPRTPGSTHVSTTAALFEMSEPEDRP